MQLKLRYHEDGDILTCHNCDSPVPTMDATGHHHNERLNGEVYLCEVCASSMLSTALFYPDQCPDPLLYQAVGWIANRILEEIKKHKPPETWRPKH